MRASVVLSLGCLLAFVAFAAATLDGICVLQPTDAGKQYGVSGTVRFVFDPETTKFKVSADIEGNALFKSRPAYAMHVHTYGDLTEPGTAESVGLHWVPAGGYPNHGCPNSDHRHGGDMGNWTVSPGIGKITQVKELDLLEMNDKQSIIGRSVVLHEHIDDCTGENGDSGTKMAWCVIGLTNADYNFAIANPILDGTTAVCVFTPTTHCPSKTTCTGTAYLRSNLTHTQVVAHVKGIKGAHGFHLRTYGDLRGNGGDMLGDDYNPFGREHGLPPIQPRHIGDLGNIQSYDPATGDAWYEYWDSYFTLTSTILGRALVVYADADRGSGRYCNSEGNAGNAIMQCVLGVAAPTTTIPAIPAGVKLNNVYRTQSCPNSDQLEDEDAAAGLLAGMVLGWVMVALLLCLILGIFGYFVYIKKQSGAGFQILSPHTYGSEL